MLGKCVCAAYICDMIRRIKAYFRLQKIIAIRMKKWEVFLEELRRESFQQRNDEGDRCHNKRNDTDPESPACAL